MEQAGSQEVKPLGKKIDYSMETKYRPLKNSALTPHLTSTYCLFSEKPAFEFREVERFISGNSLSSSFLTVLLN